MKSYWTPIALTKDCRLGKIYSAKVNNIAICFYRTNNSWKCFRDFCPHRGYPLSEGFIKDEKIICSYHGWSFDSEKNEAYVPGSDSTCSARLDKWHIKDEGGILWISKHEDKAPPVFESPYRKISLSGTVQTSPLMLFENFLEGSHTHYVHDGWVRRREQKRSKITGKLLPNEFGFEVEYEFEEAKGYLTKLLPKKYSNLKPIVRFIYPGSASLAYVNESGKLVGQFDLYVSEIASNKLVYFAQLSTSLRLLYFFPLRNIVARILIKIMEQDRTVIEKQSANIISEEKLNFLSTEADTVGKELYAWFQQQDRLSVQKKEFTVFW